MDNNNNNQLPKVTLDDLNKLDKNSINTKPMKATIVGVKIESWRDHLNDLSKLEKFEKPDQEMIFVKFKHEEEFFEDSFFPSAKPTPGSKLGRFILKYGVAPKVEMDIEIVYNSRNFKEILLKK